MKCEDCLRKGKMIERLREAIRTQDREAGQRAQNYIREIEDKNVKLGTQARTIEQLEMKLERALDKEKGAKMANMVLEAFAKDFVEKEIAPLMPKEMRPEFLALHSLRLQDKLAGAVLKIVQGDRQTWAGYLEHHCTCGRKEHNRGCPGYYATALRKRPDGHGGA